MRLFRVLFILSVSLLLSVAARAAIIASDEASNDAYLFDATGSWKGLNSAVGENPPGVDNGGSGFQAWDFAGGFHDPDFSPYGNLNHFIDGVDFPSSSYNDLGSPAFALTNANRPFFGYTSRATRTFAPLEQGDVLSLRIDNPALQPLDPFAASGFLIRLNTGQGPIIDSAPDPNVKERFGISASSNFNGGRWHAVDSDGFTDTGVSELATSSGAHFQFTLLSAETYSVEFRHLSNGQILFTRSAELKNAGSGGIDSIEITMFGNGSGGGTANNQTTGEREFFFNDLSIASDQRSLAGDFNNDGKVDGYDFKLWQLGGSHLPLSKTDLDQWNDNYGISASSTASTSAVPEPAAFVLPGWGMAIWRLLSPTRARRLLC